MKSSDYARNGFRQMVQDDLQGGTVQYNNVAYDCTVGTFERREILNQGGGFSPVMMGDVQVALNDFPIGTTFKTGQFLTVLPNTGICRTCRIHSVQYSGPLANLTLQDVNEKA